MAIKGDFSGCLPVTSSAGVLLGPLLFMLYMNDLVEGIKEFVARFPDNTKIIFSRQSKSIHVGRFRR